MKLTICDLCYDVLHFNESNGGTFVKATARAWIKSRRTGERVAIDACEKHRKFLKPFKTVDEARKGLQEYHASHPKMAKVEPSGLTMTPAPMSKKKPLAPGMKRWLIVADNERFMIDAATRRDAETDAAIYCGSVIEEVHA